MTFNSTRTVDALSWIVVISLSTKVAATLFVLIVDKDMRDQPGWGSILWWTTKVTPVIAVPCLLAIALLQGDSNLVRFSLAAALFVIVAVPLKIRQRSTRIAAARAALPPI